MNVVDPVTALFVVNVSAGVLIVAAGLWLMWERRPDDPGYTPRHAQRTVPDTSQDEIQRAVSDSRRNLRRSSAPWAPRGKRHTH